MIGKLALNEHGQIGIIFERKQHYPNETTTNWEWIYAGRTLNNNYWRSKEPKIIAESIQEFIYGETKPILEAMQQLAPINEGECMNCGEIGNWCECD